MEFRLSWSSFLHIALIHLWEIPCSLAGLNLLELLCRRPFLPNHYFLAQTPRLLGYLPYLSLLRSRLCSHTVSYFPVLTLMDPTAPALPRRQSIPQTASSWVVLALMDHTVILITLSAAKLLRHPCWYCVYRLKCAPIQNILSVQKFGLSTFWFSKMLQWKAYMLFFLEYLSLSVQLWQVLKFIFFSPSNLPSQLSLGTDAWGLQDSS